MTDDIFEEMVEEFDLEHYPAEAMRIFLEEHDDLEDFSDAYAGEFEADDEYEAIGKWQRQLHEDCGTLDKLPEEFRFYIDWNAMGRDTRMNGGMWAECDGPFTWYVFYTM